MKNLFTPRHSLFGMPAAQRFFFEEDTGGNDTSGESQSAPNETPAAFEPADGTPVIRAEQDRVDGEKLPDFGTIGKHKGAAGTPEPKKGDKPPKTEEKPAGGQPEKKTEPAKPTSEPAKAKGEPQKPAEPAKEPAKTAKIPTDAEIDALQPKPGAPTKDHVNYAEMRTKIKEAAQAGRAAEQERDTLRAEVETLKASTGKIPEDVEKELEGLRNFHLLFRAEQDPRFKQQFEAPITKAEEGIYAFLTKHGLPQEKLDEIKESAKGGDMETWAGWTDILNAFTNPIDRQQLLDSLKTRRDVIGAKAARLAELGGSREKFMEETGKMEDQERTKFANAIEKATVPLAAQNDWIIEQAIPANATPEQKAAIEAINATVKARASNFGDNVRAAYARDPEKVAELSLKAVKADYYAEQLESVTKERDASTARVKELEARLSKIQKAGRTAHVEAPSETVAAKAVSEGVGGDGQAAFERFFSNRK